MRGFGAKLEKKGFPWCRRCVLVFVEDGEAVLSKVVIAAVQPCLCGGVWFVLCVDTTNSKVVQPGVVLAKCSTFRNSTVVVGVLEL